MTLMMTSGGNGDNPDQDTKETRGTGNGDGGAGPAKRTKSKDSSETSHDLQRETNELNAALAMVDNNDHTAGGADAVGLEEEQEEGTTTEEQVKSKGGRKPSPARSKEVRLQQNRKAARDSRKRKKEMIEELQRSLIFFSRSNAKLKQQNDYLTRRLLEAQTTIQALQKQQSPSQEGEPAPQATTQTVVTPAPQAASTAAFVPALDGGPGARPSPVALDYINAAFPPVMEPGSTMQAMSNFQQAAAAAMQAAAQGMDQQEAAHQITHLTEEATDKNGNTSQAPRQDSNSLTWL
jgi:hypothetical protein